MKKFITLILLFCCTLNIYAADYILKSPDSRIVVTVSTGEITQYSVQFDGKRILDPSPISITFDNGTVIGRNFNVANVKNTTVNKILNPVIRQKSEQIIDYYNEMTLECEVYSIHFRAYNDAIAYRFETNFDEEKKVLSEESKFNFSEDFKIYYPVVDKTEINSFQSSQQPLFEYKNISQIGTGSFSCTPMLFEVNDKIRLLISEADLENYPGMFLEKEGKHEMAGKFAPIPTELTYETRQARPLKRADYIAKVEGKRSYPWRAMIITDNDANLISNEIIYKLSPDAKGDYSWVKPGKISWDWWTGNTLSGVDFKCGINTETYKYFIDFAAKYGIDYILLDDGWSEFADITKPAKEVDVKALVDYGKQKNVGLVLWISWTTLRDHPEALELYHEWGIKGIKMDFMDRDDQNMVSFLSEVAKKAAECKLIVDFHGAYKPTGWIRTYPNVLTSEGVYGMEQCKVNDLVRPGHNATLPFIRMVAGPMDYTPGAMSNYHYKDFKNRFFLPSSIGTRCHQLGMYVVYESPLQMLSDSPSNYYKEPECMEFLSEVPTVWDETKVLDAKIGEYILLARRSGDTWYIGGITGEKEYKNEICLDFIHGNKKMTIWEDGINVDRNAMDYKRHTIKIKKGEKINVKMFNGSGYVAIIK